VLLFFRHGITPTANRLYQLVKKGSMSAPAEALARFWATLREKSRVRIEHPDLPAELQSATGELAAALWTRAVDMAQDQLAAAQLEAQRSVADAQAWQVRAEAERDQSRQELTGSAAALDGAQTRITELDQALAISVAATSTLQDQLRLAQQGEQQLQRALETARRDFASELDKLCADGALAQERLKAAETRALLEIDRERQAAARLQKELGAATRKAEQGSTRHQEEVQKLHGQLGNLRQQVGVLEGNLDALRAANARYADEVAQARDQRDQLAMSLANASGKRKGSTSTPTAGSRTSSGSAGKSPRTRKA
jgi:chromosome segregation ATPase